MLVERGATGETVRSIQEILNFLHFQGRKRPEGGYSPLSVDGIFGADTEDAILSFQEDHGLYTDGRVGPVTMEALNKAFAQRQLELSSAVAFKLELLQAPADKFGEGYGRVRLRSDAATAYLGVYQEVKRQGGQLTSSGGIRDLYAPVNANRSATSFHYSGRALDLFIWSGMVNPKTDPYVVERLGDRRYRVYARCSPERSHDGACPEKRTVENCVSYTSRINGTSETDHFLDLTALFEANGFRPIRSRTTFERGGGALGAEWWHFQWEVGMIPGVSTFGDELMKLYPEAKLRPSPPWKHRHAIWKKEWF